MGAKEIVEVVGDLVAADGERLRQQHGSQALTVARDMEMALAPHMEDNPAYAPLWQQFKAAPQQQAPALAGILEVLLSADAALARRLDALLEQYQRAVRPAGNSVSTSGGAYVGGSVRVNGGDFVGRDQTKVSGDAAIAHDQGHATVTKTQGMRGQDLAALFEDVYQKIESRPPDPDVDKEELAETVKKIQQEAAKGEEANPRRVERWLKTLGLMADDIVDVTAACLLSPAAGVAAVIRKVAEKAKAEASSAQSAAKS